MKHSNKLLLGSQSPRRKELLKRAGFQFEVKTIDFDETWPEGLPSEKVASYLASGKNTAYRKQFEGYTIVTADTVVISDNQILGKPSDKEEAKKMLELLSEKAHSVITGICISNSEKSFTESVTTEVRVKALTSKEIDYYIELYKPFDKAGAYGIQEWFGLIAVEWIQGSYFNVVGLPVHQIYHLLTTEFDIRPA